MSSSLKGIGVYIHTYIHTLVQLNPGGVSAAVLVMHWSVSACIHVHMCVHAHVYVHVYVV